MTKNQTKKGILFIVGTPIGNLGDISFRAIEILKSVDFIACEDTRVTNKLLKHFEINKKTISLHEHSSKGSIEKIISLINEGKNIAYVSDAGTPGISDPGFILVKKVNEEFGSEFVRAIPGPSALATALSISPIKIEKFTFIGFLPHKKGRQTELKNIASREEVTIIFESTHRIKKLLKELSEFAPKKTVIVFKELTKIHENFFMGEPLEILSKFETKKELCKGEFIVFVI